VTISKTYTGDRSGQADAGEADCKHDGVFHSMVALGFSALTVRERNTATGAMQWVSWVGPGGPRASAPMLPQIAFFRVSRRSAARALPARADCLLSVRRGGEAGTPRGASRPNVRSGRGAE
jgi:hypothetical protein